MGDKQLAIMFLHGMGNESEDDFDEHCREFTAKLEKKLKPEYRRKTDYQFVYYQDLLQVSQQQVWDATINSDSRVDWHELRKFVLFGFGDAGTFESQSSEKGSRYQQIQELIQDRLHDALGNLASPDKPVIVIAHSLGAQVMSSYLWDSQVKKPTEGAWKFPRKIKRTTEEEKFLRLKTLRYFFTIGCNIPVFVSGKEDIRAVKTQTNGYQFEWHNFYDQDDALGWPLKPLGILYEKKSKKFGDSYDKAVKEDHCINASGDSLADKLLSGTPWSHVNYIKTGVFVDFVAESVENILSTNQATHDR